MAAPSSTKNTAGNLVASVSIAASGTNTVSLDITAKFGATVQPQFTCGTVAATAGLQVQVFAQVGSGPATDTNAILTYTITSVASTTITGPSFSLSTGSYSIKVTNLDATNGLTAYTLTSNTIDSIS